MRIEWRKNQEKCLKKKGKWRERGNEEKERRMEGRGGVEKKSGLKSEKVVFVGQV